MNSGFKPALKSKPENLGKYDIIFVGSPCWWYTIAPPVATFLSSYDLSGKTIAPFMTHEGSRMGHSEADIGFYLENIRSRRFPDLFGYGTGVAAV